MAAHNIVAVFPNMNALKLHDLCLKSGSKTIVVSVLDTCADSDCSGCCTQNKGNADARIDLESYTNERWGVPDGRLQWADLGPTKGSGCNGFPLGLKSWVAEQPALVLGDPLRGHRTPLDQPGVALGTRRPWPRSQQVRGRAWLSWLGRLEPQHHAA